MNHFAHPSAAERYARGRPYFQALVTERVKTACRLDDPVERALDVGCGTGQSAIALLDIAKHVSATDVSYAMLSRAAADSGLSYVCAAAEGLPFRARAFDLVSAGLAFHWFQRDAFLAEVRRVARPGAWLIIFNDHFSGQMVENPDYARWNKEHYARRFPAPPRDNSPFTDEDAQEYGLAIHARERFTHEVTFTARQLVSYLLTHSNIITAVEGGTDGLRSVTAWLEGSVAPLFRTPVGTFPFTCVLDIFRRNNAI